MISVIIPVYNAGPYVAEALESVLDQTLKPREIIVINDGSTDDSPAVLERYTPYIRLVSRDNRGPSVTLNEGIGMATQPLLAFLDADDVWMTGKLEKQRQLMEENPQVEGCFGYIQNFISPELDESAKQQIACPEAPQPGTIAKSSLLIRSSVFDRVGLFDPAYLVDFPEWIIRAREAGFRYEVLPEVMSRRRLHQSGLSAHRFYKRDMGRILKASLDRKRQLHG